MSDNASDVLKIESRATQFGGHVVAWRLNRPEAGNSVSLELLGALEAAADDAAKDPELRAIIIMGEEPRFFSTGADLKERATMSPAQVKDFLKRINSLFRRIETLPCPVIAAIGGFALGGGLELALACDLRIAGENAQLGLPETSLGIIPGAGGTQRLSRAIGLPRAKELIFTAARIDARRALEIGLVQSIHSPPDLSTAAFHLAADTIGRNAPIALRQAKLALNEGYDKDLEAGLKVEQKAYAVTIPTEDRVEALTAFREKRKPHFQGK
ncbi:MAG: enoyl-CoA hydratase-related protein [bacterium]|nr:enoyl-CoA hydratase-related protein [bacterium]